MKSNRKNKFIGFWIFALLLTNSMVAFAATEKYIGFWKTNSGSNKVLQFDTWEEFVEEWKELGKKDMRLQDLEAIEVGDDIKFTGTWVSGKGKYALYAYDNWTDFSDKWKSMLADKSLQLIDVEVIPLAGKNFYVGVWDTGKGGSALFQYHNWDDFVAKWKELAKIDRVLIDVEAFRNGGETKFVGVWETGIGKDQRLYATDSFSKLSDKWKEFNKEDLRLVDIDISAIKNGELYVGVWNKGTGGQYLWLADSWSGFLTKNRELNGKNLGLYDLAMVEYAKVGKPVPTSKPQTKPITKVFFYFSKDQKMEKDSVSGFDFPADMPAIVYPKFEGCNASDRETIEKAWALAHHHAWRAYQFFQFLDKSGNRRDDLWKADYTAGSNLTERKNSYSPYAWFGEYDGGAYRFPYIRDAIDKNWNKRFLEKNTAKCRRKDDGGSHPCYKNNPGTGKTPSANHIVSGTVNYCNRFFDKNRTDNSRAKGILHEMFHWLAPKGLAILDTHTHSDKKNGWCKTDTDKMYGEDDAMHLATSKGCWGKPKYHRGMAARNNDNYAFFISRLGSAIYFDNLKRIPTK